MIEENLKVNIKTLSNGNFKARDNNPVQGTEGVLIPELSPQNWTDDPDNQFVQGHIQIQK